jgi:glucan 1,3-beta-glucosidase
VSWKKKQQRYIDLGLTHLEDVNTVTSIGLLNEPAGFYGDPLMSTTRQFWQDAYHDARSASGGQNSQLIVIHDAFQPLSSWTNFMSPPDYQQVAIDHHHYQVFSPSEVSQSWDQHLQQICNVKNNYQDSTLWLLTGEWSLATTDCAKWLNGRGRGSRYQGEYDGGWWIGSCNDKTGSGDNFSR